MDKNTRPFELYAIGATTLLGILGSIALVVYHLVNGNPLNEFIVAYGMGLLATITLHLYSSPEHYAIVGDPIGKYLLLGLLKTFVILESFILLYVLQVILTGLGVLSFFPNEATELGYFCLIVVAILYGLLLSKWYAVALKHFLWNGFNEMTAKEGSDVIWAKVFNNYNEFVVENYMLVRIVVTVLSILGILGAISTGVNEIFGFFGKVGNNPFWTYALVGVVIMTALNVLMIGGIQAAIGDKYNVKTYGWWEFYYDLNGILGVSCFHLIAFYLVLLNNVKIDWLLCAQFCITYLGVLIIISSTQLRVNLGKHGLSEEQIKVGLDIKE